MQIYATSKVVFFKLYVFKQYLKLYSYITSFVFFIRRADMFFSNKIVVGM